MHKVRLGSVALALILSAAPVFAVCTGDLNSDNRVDVVEIIDSVNCALDDSRSGCSRTQVDGVVEAINNALLGCRADEPVWMSLLTCGQCEPCQLDYLLTGGADPYFFWEPGRYVPVGVLPLDQRIVTPEIVCFACGCPAGPILYALVRAEDAEQMLAAGWRPSR